MFESTPRIMIFTDDPALGELLRLTLDTLAVDIYLTANRTEVLRLNRRYPFDLVLVVGIAALFTGDELLRRLRPAGRSRPQLYVLAWQQNEVVVTNLLAAGVNQYLTLPVSLSRLRAKVANLLNNHQ